MLGAQERCQALTTGVQANTSRRHKQCQAAQRRPRRARAAPRTHLAGVGRGEYSSRQGSAASAGRTRPSAQTCSGCGVRACMRVCEHVRGGVSFQTEWWAGSCGCATQQAARAEHATQGTVQAACRGWHRKGTGAERGACFCVCVRACARQHSAQTLHRTHQEMSRDSGSPLTSVSNTLASSIATTCAFGVWVCFWCVCVCASVRWRRL
jgi:hypothetical protein